MFSKMLYRAAELIGAPNYSCICDLITSSIKIKLYKHWISINYYRMNEIYKIDDSFDLNHSDILTFRDRPCARSAHRWCPSPCLIFGLSRLWKQLFQRLESQPGKAGSWSRHIWDEIVCVCSFWGIPWNRFCWVCLFSRLGIMISSVSQICWNLRTHGRSLPVRIRVQIRLRLDLHRWRMGELLYC